MGRAIKHLIQCRLTDSIVVNTEQCPGLFHEAENLCQCHAGCWQLVMQYILMMLTQLRVTERIGHKLLQQSHIGSVTAHTDCHCVAITKSGNNIHKTTTQLKRLKHPVKKIHTIPWPRCRRHQGKCRKLFFTKRLAYFPEQF